MGRYLNQGNESFEKSVNSEIYIDKTGVIKYTNRVLNTLQGYVCIRRPDEKIRKKVQENWDSLAKPLDGLGIFEKIFTQIGAVTGDERVPLQKKAVIVMCADNGIVEEGISQSGQEVTYQVAESMGKRKSSVCLMAAQANANKKLFKTAGDDGGGSIGCDRSWHRQCKKVQRGWCDTACNRGDGNWKHDDKQRSGGGIVKL